MKKKTIPAYVIDVEKIDAKMLRQVLNKLRGEHDPLKDASEFVEILNAKKLDRLADLLAEPVEVMNGAMAKYGLIDFKEEEEVPEPPKKPKSKLGQIYQLDNHRVVCGDATKKMIECKADLLLTDPPYGVDYASKNRFLNSIGRSNSVQKPILNDDIEDYRKWFGEWLDKIQFSDYNSYYITISGQKLLDLSQALLDNNYKISQYLVWVKNNHVLGRQDYANKHELIIYGWKNHHEFYGPFQTTVWEIDRPLKSKLHPTMKPIELMQKAIQNSSKEKGIILDPFLGSGSTLIACEQTNRICYGMEIDPAYIDVIIERWENYTGKKAKLLT